MKTIGVIGLGSIGMKHAKNLMAMGHNVVGFDPEVAAEDFPSFWKLWPGARMETLDGIIIASPTSMHQFHICDTLNTTRNIFVEKPISDRWTENTDLLTLVKMVGYNLRYHSCVKKAKELLSQDLIGIPLWANFTLGQHSIKEPYLRDGVILNWSHELDLALYLLGPASVAGSSTRLTDGKDDISDILLTHLSGCRTTVHLDYIAQPEQRYFTITGNRGYIYVNIVTRRASIKWNGDMGPIFTGEDTWNDNYIEEMQEFLDSINDPNAHKIGATGAEGLEVLKICLAVRAAAGLT